MRNSISEWVFPELFDVPGYYRSQIGGYSIVSQTLFRRGLTTLEAAQGFLNPDLYLPTSPNELPGAQKAAKRLLSAISNEESILVWGDFDVDGQTSTSLFVTALLELGGQVNFYIPNRALESHGVSLPSLKNVIEKFKPSVLLTCDTGVDAIEAVEYAATNNIDVIITDHHQIPNKLPPAFSIVNPNFLKETHPLFSLPGVGVAFKVIEELFSYDGRSTDHFLDLVALGIVADVANISGDTRYLLQVGLPILSKTSRLGLKHLYNNANLSPGSISEEQISFVIGPRLNALGRLSDANSCVDFFTTHNIDRAAALAKRLEDLNEQRQQLTETIYQDALAQLASDPWIIEDYPILVLEGPPSWNPGVIGIVASRLVEQFHRPAIMLTQDGDQARGSARSIQGVSISDLIKSTSNLLIRFGGHPMAAGLSLPIENIAQFRRALAKSYTNQIGDAPPIQKITIDEILPFQSISHDYIKEFQRLAPFGAGNPSLLFATRGVTVNSDKVIGKNKNHRKLSVKDGPGIPLEILWWNSADINIPSGPLDIAYSLGISSYKGKDQIQVILKHIRQSCEIPIQINVTKPLEIIDYRNQSNPADILPKLIKNYPEVLIWAENNCPEDYPSFPRKSLHKSSHLLIWTSPPSMEVFKKVIDNVSPSEIILIAEDPPDQNNRAILKSILGMLRHMQDTSKDYDPELFAQSIAQTTALIQAAMDWLHHHGDYDLSKLRSENTVLPGSGSSLHGFDQINDRFNLLLNEIFSYRSHFKHVDKEYLL